MGGGGGGYLGTGQQKLRSQCCTLRKPEFPCKSSLATKFIFNEIPIFMCACLDLLTLTSNFIHASFRITLKLLVILCFRPNLILNLHEDSNDRQASSLVL
jgi:hypothetical protein